MLISEEHLQLQAVFLAFLTPEISAAVLSYLNESVQNEILYRVAKLNDVNRDVVDELDRLIDSNNGLWSRCRFAAFQYTRR